MLKSVSPIEIEFRLQYGCYPYEYFLKRRQHGHTNDEAAAKMQAAIDKVWLDMKYTYKKQLSECPVSDVYEPDYFPKTSECDEDAFFNDDFFNYLVGSYNSFL